MEKGQGGGVMAKEGHEEGSFPVLGPLLIKS